MGRFLRRNVGGIGQAALPDGARGPKICVNNSKRSQGSFMREKLLRFSGPVMVIALAVGAIPVDQFDPVSHAPSPPPPVQVTTEKNHAYNDKAET